MRKQMIVAAVAAAMLCLSGCSQVDAAKEAVTGKPAEETNTVKTKLTGYEKGNLTPDQFYIKKIICIIRFIWEKQIFRKKTDVFMPEVLQEMKKRGSVFYEPDS